MQPIVKMRGISLWLTVFFTLAVTAALDGLTGFEVSLLLFYFFPVLLAAWSRGIRGALLASFFVAIAWWLANRWTGHHYTHQWVSYWNALMRLLLFGISGIFVARLHAAMREKDAIIRELQLSLRQIKTLAGHIPICPSCRRIRGDEGEWEDLEAYVREKSHIEFLSVVCPHCVPGEESEKNSAAKV